VCSSEYIPRCHRTNQSASISRPYRSRQRRPISPTRSRRTRFRSPTPAKAVAQSPTTSRLFSARSSTGTRVQSPGSRSCIATRTESGTVSVGTEKPHRCLRSEILDSCTPRRSRRSRLVQFLPNRVIVKPTGMRKKKTVNNINAFVHTAIFVFLTTMALGLLMYGVWSR
jgi:hypothetical protein